MAGSRGEEAPTRGELGGVPGFPGATVGCVNVSWKRGIRPSEQNCKILTPSSGVREGVYQRFRGSPEGKLGTTLGHPEMIFLSPSPTL